MYHLEPQVTIPKPESTLKKTIKKVSKFYSTSKSMRGKRGTLRRVKGQWGALSEEDDLEFFKTSNVTSACLLYHTSMTMINLDQFQHCSLASVCKSGIHAHCIVFVHLYSTIQCTWLPHVQTQTNKQNSTVIDLDLSSSSVGQCTSPVYILRTCKNSYNAHAYINIYKLITARNLTAL